MPHALLYPEFYETDVLDKEYPYTEVCVKSPGNAKTLRITLWVHKKTGSPSETRVRACPRTFDADHRTLRMIPTTI